MQGTSPQLAQNAPDFQQFLDAFVVRGSVIEMIDQDLYDRMQYPLAGSANITFFATGVGNGLSSETTAGAGVAKTYADTNLEGQGGALPAPMAFWARDVQIDYDAGSVTTASTYTNQVPTYFGATAAATTTLGLNEKQAVLNAGYLSFDIGQKNYLRGGPLRRFPPAVNWRTDGAAAMAGTNAQPAGLAIATGRSEGVWGKPMRNLDPGVGIPTAMNFKVAAVFPVAVATTNNGRLQCVLGGWLLRAVQ